MTGILWLVPLNPIIISRRYANTQKRQHITLAYGVERNQYANIIGSYTGVGLLAECWNREVQAVSVVLQSWLPCQNVHPHITLSWIDGSAPVKANLMLEGEHQSRNLGAHMLFCRVEFLEWE